MAQQMFVGARLCVYCRHQQIANCFALAALPSDNCEQLEMTPDANQYRQRLDAYVYFQSGTTHLSTLGHRGTLCRCYCKNRRSDLGVECSDRTSRTQHEYSATMVPSDAPVSADNERRLVAFFRTLLTLGRIPCTAQAPRYECQEQIVSRTLHIEVRDSAAETRIVHCRDDDSSDIHACLQRGEAVPVHNSERYNLYYTLAGAGSSARLDEVVLVCGGHRHDRLHCLETSNGFENYTDTWL
jgi:hypothetical protein